jgi:hypothetical protein
MVPDTSSDRGARATDRTAAATTARLRVAGRTSARTGTRSAISAALTGPATVVRTARWPVSDRVPDSTPWEGSPRGSTTPVSCLPEVRRVRGGRRRPRRSDARRVPAAGRHGPPSRCARGRRSVLPELRGCARRAPSTVARGRGRGVHTVVARLGPRITPRRRKQAACSAAMGFRDRIGSGAALLHAATHWIAWSF